MTKIKWSADPMHSEIHFKAKHLMITTVTGKLTDYSITAETDGDDFTTARIHFSAKVDSINTGQEMRDTHLKSDDFFNAAQFPEIKFDSTQLKKVSGDNFKLEGNLTIRDVTKKIELDVEFEGIALDPYGNSKTGWEIKGKVSRKDFNLKWNAVTEAGTIMVADEIKIEATVQLVKHQVAEPIA
jgi:polyisoprenoid-binding protein YceI